MNMRGGRRDGGDGGRVFRDGRFGSLIWLSVVALLCMPACTKTASSPKMLGTSGITGGGSGAGGGTSSSAGSGGAKPLSSGMPMAGSGGGGVGGQSAGAGGGAAAGSGGAAAGTGGASGMSAAGTGGAGGGSGAGDCTRDLLKTTIDAYFTALAAHDSKTLPLASNVKWTENGKTMTVGDGLWKTAGMVKFKRSALDTVTCNSVSESVLPESGTDRIFGLRLKLEDQKITEIETIIVRSGDYILNNPSALAATSSDDWETVLPAAQQPTRDLLMMLMDVYFNQFPNGACNFASDCTRLEDGGSVGGCTGLGIGCMASSGGTAAMTARLHVLDTEAGITVGFTMFAGTYTDFHLFKVRDGMVHGVHAVLASATSSGWQ